MQLDHNNNPIGQDEGAEDAAGRPAEPPSVGGDAVARDISAGVVLYWVISEGLRIVFPPRNLVPVP